MDNNRQTGRTTEAIHTSPPGAIYVIWSASAADYVRNICHRLGREDIKLWPVSRLRALRGTERFIVVDHHVWQVIDRQENADLRHLLAMQAARNDHASL